MSTKSNKRTRTKGYIKTKWEREDKDISIAVQAEQAEAARKIETDPIGIKALDKMLSRAINEA